MTSTRRPDRNKWYQRLPGALLNWGMLFVVFAILALAREGMVCGWSRKAPDTGTAALLDLARNTFPAAYALRPTADGFAIDDRNGVPLGTLRLTAGDTAHIHGYGGPIPLAILGDTAGKIAAVMPLRNAEDPAFLARVTEAGLFERWNRLTPDEAVAWPVDAVTGATFTSDAVIRSVRTSLAAAHGLTAGAPLQRGAAWRLWFGVAALVTALALALFRPGDRRARTVQLWINVIALGMIAGSFLSLNGVLARVAVGSWFGANWLVGCLLAAMLVLPVWTGRAFYCVWACPFGSAQELIRRCNRRDTDRGELVWRRLRFMRDWLVAALLFLWFLGVGMAVMNAELFPALVWGVWDYPLLAGAAAIGIVSYWVKRPYCRFLCPTGWLIQFSEQFSRENRHE